MSLVCSPPVGSRGTGNGACSHFITHLCLSFFLRARTPHTPPLLQCGVPSTWDSFPGTSPVWVLPMGCTSSQTAPVWSLPWGTVLQEPFRGPVGTIKPAPVWAPLSTGSQVLPGACGAQELQGLSCLTMGCSRDCRGISVPVPGAPPAPPLTLVSLGLFLSCSHPSLWLKCSFTPYPFLICYPRGSATVSAGLSLGQQWVRLGPSWHWICQKWGKLLASSHGSCSCSPLLPEPCHASQIQHPHSLGSRCPVQSSKSQVAGIACDLFLKPRKIALCPSRAVLATAWVEEAVSRWCTREPERETDRIFSGS